MVCINNKSELKEFARRFFNGYPAYSKEKKKQMSELFIYATIHNAIVEWHYRGIYLAFIIDFYTELEHRRLNAIFEEGKGLSQV